MGYEEDIIKSLDAYKHFLRQDISASYATVQYICILQANYIKGAKCVKSAHKFQSRIQKLLLPK